MSDTEKETGARERRQPGWFHGLTMQNVIVSLGLALFGAFLAFSSTWYWFEKSAAIRAGEIAAEARQKIIADQVITDAAMKARLAELKLQLNLVRQAVIPISAAFQAVLIKELTHYHTPQTDALLAKLSAKTLTIAEEKELIRALARRTKDMGPKISDSERDAATILPFVMKRVRTQAIASKNTPFGGDVRSLRIVSISDAANDEIKQEELRGIAGGTK
jgi:hypothetical protein